MKVRTEEQARAILAEGRIAAADPARYGAARYPLGWVFSWRREAGPALMGTTSWAVACNGRFASVTLADTVDGVLSRLSGQSC